MGILHFRAKEETEKNNPNSGRTDQRKYILLKQNETQLHYEDTRQSGLVQGNSHL